LLLLLYAVLLHVVVLHAELLHVVLLDLVLKLLQDSGHLWIVQPRMPVVLDDKLLERLRAARNCADEADGVTRGIRSDVTGRPGNDGFDALLVVV
jgi:hypothetical protein